MLGLSSWLLIPLYGVFGAIAARFLAPLTGTVATLRVMRRAVDAASAEITNGPEPGKE